MSLAVVVTTCSHHIVHRPAVWLVALVTVIAATPSSSRLLSLRRPLLILPTLSTFSARRRHCHLHPNVTLTAVIASSSTRSCDPIPQSAKQHRPCHCRCNVPMQSLRDADVNISVSVGIGVNCVCLAFLSTLGGAVLLCPISSCSQRSPPPL